MSESRCIHRRIRAARRTRTVKARVRVRSACTKGFRVSTQPGAVEQTRTRAKVFHHHLPSYDAPVATLQIVRAARVDAQIHPPWPRDAFCSSTRRHSSSHRWRSADTSSPPPAPPSDLRPRHTALALDDRQTAQMRVTANSISRPEGLACAQQGRWFCRCRRADTSTVPAAHPAPFDGDDSPIDGSHTTAQRYTFSSTHCRFSATAPHTPRAHTVVRGSSRSLIPDSPAGTAQTHTALTTLPSPRSAHTQGANRVQATQLSLRHHGRSALAAACKGRPDAAPRDSEDSTRLKVAPQFLAPSPRPAHQDSLDSESGRKRNEKKKKKDVHRPDILNVPCMYGVFDYERKSVSEVQESGDENTDRWEEEREEERCGLLSRSPHVVLCSRDGSPLPTPRVLHAPRPFSAPRRYTARALILVPARTHYPRPPRHPLAHKPSSAPSASASARSAPPQTQTAQGHTLGHPLRPTDTRIDGEREKMHLLIPIARCCGAAVKARVADVWGQTAPLPDILNTRVSPDAKPAYHLLPSSSSRAHLVRGLAPHEDHASMRVHASPSASAPPPQAHPPKRRRHEYARASSSPRALIVFPARGHYKKRGEKRKEKAGDTRCKIQERVRAYAEEPENIKRRVGDRAATSRYVGRKMGSQSQTYEGAHDFSHDAHSLLCRYCLPSDARNHRDSLLRRAHPRDPDRPRRGRDHDTSNVYSAVGLPPQIHRIAYLRMRIPIHPRPSLTGQGAYQPAGTNTSMQKQGETQQNATSDQPPSCSFSTQTTRATSPLNFQIAAIWLRRTSRRPQHRTLIPGSIKRSTPQNLNLDSTSSVSHPGRRLNPASSLGEVGPTVGRQLLFLSVQQPKAGQKMPRHFSLEASESQVKVERKEGTGDPGSLIGSIICRASAQAQLNRSAFNHATLGISVAIDEHVPQEDVFIIFLYVPRTLALYHPGPN
ncbi:hypothetical protein DFH06DRAFT_1129384 [Mycena polygramma]|nr:hypothetical protein DFH06DRAFT_1129384 [Mycena polygramma]